MLKLINHGQNHSIKEIYTINVIGKNHFVLLLNQNAVSQAD
jgi:hypothetical protein